MDYRKHHSSKFWSHLFVAFFIWLPLPFMLVLDMFCELYQAICFPVYGLEKVKRSEYILVRDRNKLAYLNGWEKISCMYCGYGNGLFLYLKEISGRTEKYWCGIMHENKPGFKQQSDQIARNFAQFDDEEDFVKKYPLD